jgi:hypothetical protein
LGRFDNLANQLVKRRFVGGSDAGRFGLGDEICQSVEPNGLIQG